MVLGICRKLPILTRSSGTTIDLCAYILRLLTLYQRCLQEPPKYCRHRQHRAAGGLESYRSSFLEPRTCGFKSSHPQAAAEGKFYFTCHILVHTTYLKSQNRRLLILATTSKRTELQQLDIFEDFDDEIAVPNVNTQQELAHVLQSSGAFSEQDQQRTMYEIARYMADNRRTDVGVGIKKVLDSIEIARKDPDVAGRFAQRIIQAMIASGMA